MDNKDQQLRALLTNWRDIECSPAFNAGVWERIGMVPAPRRGWVESFCILLEKRLATVTTEAALASAMAGFALALFIVPPSKATELQPFRFMTPTSLSGSFNQLAWGVTR